MESEKTNLIEDPNSLSPDVKKQNILNEVQEEPQSSTSKRNSTRSKKSIFRQETFSDTLINKRKQ